MKKTHLYLLVAIAGVVIMAIEILGLRVLGPFFGMSVYLWSVFLAMTLAALSTGFMLGGRRAGQGASVWLLNLSLLIAGGWLILIPLLKIPVLNLANLFGFRLMALLAVFTFFFPPLTSLGMVLPLAVRSNTNELNSVGRTAGHVYAIAALAGSLSAMVTSLLLLPNFGVTRLMHLFGLATMLAAVWGFWLNRKYGRKMVIISLISIFLGLLLSWQAPKMKIEPENGQLFVQQSVLGEISVVDKDEVRYLLINGAVRTAVRDSTLETVQSYGVVLDLCKELFFHSGELLLIGLGGGSVANDFMKDNWKVDILESDPVIIDAAERFFQLNTKRCQIYEGDSRQMLLQRSEQYDFIILDTPGGNSTLSHLISKEMFQLISSRLNKNGILAVNIEAIGWDAAVIQSVAKTLHLYFQKVIALPTAEPPNTLGHVVILAANRELEIEDDVLGHPSDYVNLDLYLHWVVVQRNHAWANRYEPETKDAKIITDDLNPADLWAETVNLAVRQKMKETFKLNINNF